MHLRFVKSYYPIKMSSGEDLLKEKSEADVLNENASAPSECERPPLKVDSISPTEEKHIDSSPPTSLEKQIIRQIEYYFGDLNMMRDKFLLEKIKEEDGWVSLEVLLTFNRLKSLSTDSQVIVTALQKSTSGLMEINSDKLKIRRSPSRPLQVLNSDRALELKKRSVYGKGFPADETLDHLLSFFEQYGKTEQVYMRKDKLRQFKGSCFVVFETEEGAKKFIEGSEKFNEVHEIARMFKVDYFKKKSADRKALKETNLEDKVEEKIAEVKKDKAKNEKAEQDAITTGAILVLDNIPENVTREDLKEIFTDHGTLLWQDFNKGDKQAKLRFEEEGGAKAAWDRAVDAGHGKVEVKGHELTGRVLEGDEEIQHWKDLRQQQKDRKQKSHHHHGRGGKRRGGKRPQMDRRDGAEPRSKKQRNEDGDS